MASRDVVASTIGLVSFTILRPTQFTHNLNLTSALAFNKVFRSESSPSSGSLFDLNTLPQTVDSPCFILRIFFGPNGLISFSYAKTSTMPHVPKLAVASNEAFSNFINAHRFSGNFHKTLTSAAAVEFASVSPLQTAPSDVLLLMHWLCLGLQLSLSLP